jgi:hypothetical protein
MGSAHPVRVAVAEYENPLIVNQESEVHMVDMMFQLALDDKRRNVTIVPDQSMVEEGSYRYNPFLKLKQELSSRQRVACVERVYVHQLKNTTDVQVTVRIDQFFSMPPDHPLKCGCPAQVPSDGSSKPHADDTNRLVFDVAGQCSQFTSQGIKVYTKRVGDGQYHKWAGMDAAFAVPAEAPIREQVADSEDGSETITIKVMPECDFDVLPDAHAMVRAMRMYMPEAEVQWKTTLNAKGDPVHRVPITQTKEIRRRMNSTFFAQRRYTTFNGTNVYLALTPEAQAELNAKWLEKLKDVTQPRPVVQAILSVSMIAFGKGEPEMNVVQLKLE